MNARDVVAAPFLLAGLACFGVAIVCLVGARTAWGMWRR